jgi:hypothetical protein
MYIVIDFIFFGGKIIAENGFFSASWMYTPKKFQRKGSDFIYTHNKNNLFVNAE